MIKCPNIYDDPWIYPSIQTDRSISLDKRVYPHIFLISLQKHMLWGSLEAPLRGASNEHHNICFQGEIRKNISTFWLKKSALSGALRSVQTEKTKIRHYRMWHITRIYIVCRSSSIKYFTHMNLFHGLVQILEYIFLGDKVSKYLGYLTHFVWKTQNGLLANSADPDQMPHMVSNLCLHCLH